MNNPKAILKQYFGYEDFNQGQEEIISGILQGRDALGIMPTGAGKSICYQIPGLMLPGITLVVSPLISLMKDQVESLNAAGIRAAYFNSSLSNNQYLKALEYAKQGTYKIIYVAPERLETPMFLEFIKCVDIEMVSVDEAHCVSQWGQDFRPSYLKIAEFIKKFPQRPRVSAFTATATKTVQKDIIELLHLQNPKIMLTGFDRKNLYFGVERPKDRMGLLRKYVNEFQGQSGIIYCLTRKNVEEVCFRLQQDGHEATRYHAGLGDKERKKNQEDFIYDKIPIMVATNAFGMGIDKSNVRYVIHYNMPKNIESYYQEAGRAGRDGENAKCILFYGGQDVNTNMYFIENNRDNSELSFAETQAIKEKDRERLRKIQQYCLTKKCLRSYIMEYFGEKPYDFCGNCGNCQADFETVDISDVAKIIIGCIQENSWDFGMVTIIDTLRGSKNAKVLKARLDENPFYGKLSTLKAVKIRQIMEHLILEDYLALSTTEFPVLKLTEKSLTVLENQETLSMRINQDNFEEPKNNEVRAKVKVKFQDELNLNEQNLFGKLRDLRWELAQEAGIPPYIVFSDKTLKEMCILKPQSKEGMLGVSGVGEIKYQRYGESFLRILKDWDFTKEDFENGDFQGKLQNTLPQPLDFDEKELFSELQDLRAEIAEEYEIAPFNVFSDRILRIICRFQPKSKSEMLLIMDEMAYEQYGYRFLNYLEDK
ncbi:MAG: DNA helicase RecQ [Clostridiales bacterium]